MMVALSVPPDPHSLKMLLPFDPMASMNMVSDEVTLAELTDGDDLSDIDLSQAAELLPGTEELEGLEFDKLFSEVTNVIDPEEDDVLSVSSPTGSTVTEDRGAYDSACSDNLDSPGPELIGAPESCIPLVALAVASMSDSEDVTVTEKVNKKTSRQKRKAPSKRNTASKAKKPKVKETYVSFVKTEPGEYVAYPTVPQPQVKPHLAPPAHCHKTRYVTQYQKYTDAKKQPEAPKQCSPLPTPPPAPKAVHPTATATVQIPPATTTVQIPPATTTVQIPPTQTTVPPRPAPVQKTISPSMMFPAIRSQLLGGAASRPVVEVKVKEEVVEPQCTTKIPTPPPVSVPTVTYVPNVVNTVLPPLVQPHHLPQQHQQQFHELTTKPTIQNVTNSVRPVCSTTVAPCSIPKVADLSVSPQSSEPTSPDDAFFDENFCSASEASDEESDSETKYGAKNPRLNRRRYNNRVAAQRCRQRKREHFQGLKKEIQGFECQNTRLRYEIHVLQKELKVLSTVWNEHLQKCDNIDNSRSSRKRKHKSKKSRRHSKEAKKDVVEDVK